MPDPLTFHGAAIVPDPPDRSSRKITSLTLPRAMWDLVHRLAAERKVKGLPHCSVNAILVDALRGEVATWDLELRELRGRRP